MKAIVQDEYGSADVLSVGSVERPTIGDRDVLVRVVAAGVDYGVWHAMTGLPLIARLGFGLRRPRNRVLGLDLAGVVEEVGAKVTRFQPGDAVFGSGRSSFAEFAKAREFALAPKPPGLTFEQAAALTVSGVTAVRAVHDAGQVRAGQRVLVIGAGGGVGSLAVQVARGADAHVTGVCSTAKVELVRSLGAQAVIDYTREDLTGEYDLIIDTAGNRPLPVLRRLLAARGTLVIIGGERGGRWFAGLDRGLRAMALTPFTRQRFRAPIAIIRPGDLDRLCELVESGVLTPSVGRVYRFAEAPAAIRDLAAGDAPGKLVVAVSDQPA